MHTTRHICLAKTTPLIPIKASSEVMPDGGQVPEEVHQKTCRPDSGHIGLFFLDGSDSKPHIEYQYPMIHDLLMFFWANF